MRLLTFLGVFLLAGLVPPLPARAAERPGEPPGRDPAPAGEAPGPVGGEIRSEGSRTEILPEPPPVGRTVNTPEGWYRVEAAPSRDTGATGSLSVVPRAAFAPPPAPPPAPRGSTPAPAPAPEEAAVEVTVEGAAAEDPCREEKARYLSRLLAFLEIDDVEDPLALFEGLEELPAGAGLGPFLRLSIFGTPAGGPVAVDPVRPLAWDPELRSVARDLSRCIRERR
jgi:hypothetical protein